MNPAFSNPEVGRELKVSELRPRTIVVLHKVGRDNFLVTMWVVEILPAYVKFTAGEIRTDFIARRCGPGLDEITDNTGLPMKVYEYLGEP